MYEFVKSTHSSLRWVLLALLLFVIIRHWLAYLQKKNYSKMDNATAGALVGMAHLQLILGLLLYFGLSPITKAAFSDFGAAMKDPATRLILVEHFTVNIIAIVLATVVNAKNKKAITDAAKFKNMWLLNGLGLVLILSRIPWSRLAALFA